MRKTELALATSLILLSGLALAADHRDGPLATGDPSADLNDVYLFMNPNDADELIVIGTALPDAGQGGRFSDAVEYRFHFNSQNATGPENATQTISCKFSAGGARVLCRGPGDILYADGRVGEIVDADELRVFAGLTDDPFFFDGPQFGRIRTGQAAGFNNPGTNSFGSFNTLSLALGIDADRLTNNGANPILKVWVSSHRLDESGISAGHSGMWYDTANPGHGFILQALDEGALGAGSPRSMVAYWNVFNNDGSQLALYGIGPIVNDKVNMTVASGSGGRFPPAFMSSQVTQSNFGTVTFTFTGCTSGTAQVQPTRSGFSPVPINLTRLSQAENLPCTFYSSGQIDRNGRPAINTALIDSVTPDTGLKDVYNRSANPADWPALFQAEMTTSIGILDTVDTITGNTLLPPATLASVLVDDRLAINTSIATCDAYLAVELGLAGQCGGRTLERDVIDDSLGALVGPGVSDNVPDDSTYLTDFPFVGLPR